MATYYCAPSGGSDSNDGTNINQPWATLAHAFTAAEITGGDTVYFRGGTWYPTSGILVEDKVGSAGNLIRYEAYPDDLAAGNPPIFDFTNKNVNGEALFYMNCGYIYTKGLVIRNNTYGELLDRSGFTVQFGGNFTYERCVASNCGTRGFYMCSYTSVTLINCDSYGNSDGDTGNHGEGFCFIRDATYNPHPTYSLTVVGCRAWANSDAGFSSNYGDVETIYNCWSFDNGRLTGEGVGYKYLPSAWLGAGVKGRIIYNCISAHNGHGTSFTDCNSGFEENGVDGTLCDYTIDNCLIYDNYGPGVRTIGGTDNGTTRVIRNCIFYQNGGGNTQLNNGQAPTFSYNSYQSPPNKVVSAADFVSLDWTQLQGNRKADGSLPDITFGKLVQGSDLIGAGMNVGLSTDGAGNAFSNPPSLGPFEYAPESLCTINDALSANWSTI